MKISACILKKNPKPTISYSHRAVAGKTKLLVRNCLLFSEDQQALETEVFQYDSFLLLLFIGSYFL